jgi:heptosyltransferase-2
MARPMKLLVVQFSSIGDIVLASPVVRCLKLQLPNTEVHFCTKLSYQALVNYNPHIDGRHFLDDNLYTLIRQLRAEKFDYIIDLQNTFVTDVIKLALGTRSYSVQKKAVRQWFYKSWKVNAMPDEHVVDRYMAVVQPLQVVNDNMGLDYFVPYRDEVELDWLPDTHRHDFVAYAIGGRHETRRLPVSRIIELCHKIDYPIVLLGDKADYKVAEEVVQVLGNRLIYNACGYYNINQSASLLAQARVVFTHDTGMMHIAAAFGKKVYSIWGSTTPQFGFYPYQTAHVRLEAKGLGCRPCSATGLDKCPLKHFKCMKNLSFDFEVKELRSKKKNFE